jgi:hypothetical protein
MAKAFAPITKPLEEMNRDELFALAQEREIPGRYDMKKADLLKALEEELTKPESDSEADGDSEEEGDGEGDADAEPKTNPENPKPSETPPADPDPAQEKAALEAQLLKDAQDRETKLRQEEAAELDRQAQDAQARSEKKRADDEAAHAAGLLTEEDKLEIVRSTDAQLAEALKPVADGEQPLPDFVRVALEAEVARRANVKKTAAAKALVKSPTRQFRITGGPKDMRYVTPTAYVTTLPVGSIVSPLAHDMVHVQEQGFTWEPVVGIELGEDQLGNKTSTAK